MKEHFYQMQTVYKRNYHIRDNYIQINCSNSDLWQVTLIIYASKIIEIVLSVLW